MKLLFAVSVFAVAFSPFAHASTVLKKGWISDQRAENQPPNKFDKPPPNSVEMPSLYSDESQPKIATPMRSLVESEFELTQDEDYVKPPPKPVIVKKFTPTINKLSLSEEEFSVGMQELDKVNLKIKELKQTRASCVKKAFIFASKMEHLLELQAKRQAIFGDIAEFSNVFNQKILEINENINSLKSEALDFVYEAKSKSEDEMVSAAKHAAETVKRYIGETIEIFTIKTNFKQIIHEMNLVKMRKCLTLFNKIFFDINQQITYSKDYIAVFNDVLDDLQKKQKLGESAKITRTEINSLSEIFERLYVVLSEASGNITVHQITQARNVKIIGNGIAAAIDRIAAIAAEAGHVLA